MSNARFSILQARAVGDKRLSDAQFRTLAALGTFGDKEGWCYPKQKTIGEMLGKSQQAVSRDVQALVRLGYLEVKPSYREDGGREHNLYRIRFDLPPQQDVVTPTTSEVVTPTTSEVVTPTTSEVVALTPHINDSINAPINTVFEKFEIFELPEEIKEEMKTLDEHRQSTLQAMANSFQRTAKGIDLSSYPEDVRPTIELVCDLWKIYPRKKDYSEWLESARDLRDACGELGLDVIREYRRDFERVMDANVRKGIGGVAPHNVSSPRSLIKVCASKAGNMRCALESNQDDGMKTIVVPVGGVETELRVPKHYRVHSKGSIL